MLVHLDRTPYSVYKTGLVYFYVVYLFVISRAVYLYMYNLAVYILPTTAHDYGRYPRGALSANVK